MNEENKKKIYVKNTISFISNGFALKAFTFPLLEKDVNSINPKHVPALKCRNDLKRNAIDWSYGICSPFVRESGLGF